VGDAADRGLPDLTPTLSAPWGGEGEERASAGRPSDGLFGNDGCCVGDPGEFSITLSRIEFADLGMLHRLARLPEIMGHLQPQPGFGARAETL
jgi:hypothetical protein